MPVSGKDIVIPKPTLMDEFRQLMDAVGSNKNDRAHVLIVACIGYRIDTIGHIIDVATRLGFNRKHIGALINRGRDHHWRRDSNGIYTLIEA